MIASCAPLTSTWKRRIPGSRAPTQSWIDRLIAYFSMEFGLHETLPIYAGGLGVLSGDHAKEASDLGLPFVAVGFFYTEGYFTQRITEDGWQEARYDPHPFNELPVIPLLDEKGKPMPFRLSFPVVR